MMHLLHLFIVIHCGLDLLIGEVYQSGAITATRL